MTPADLLTVFSTQTEIAAKCGISQPSVAEWFANGYVPPVRQFQIEVLTGGKLKADPVKRAEAA